MAIRFQKGHSGLDFLRKGLCARMISAFTTFFFTFVFYLNPTGLAVADEINKEANRLAALEAAQEKTPEEALSHRLNKLRDKIVVQVPQALDDKAKHRGWLGKAKQKVLPDMPLESSDVNDLRKLQSGIDSAYQQSINSFEQEANSILAASTKLTPDAQKLVKERHQAALSSIKTQYKTTQDQLNNLLAADSSDTQQKALDELTKSLTHTSFKRSHTPVNPDKLPWGQPKEQTREPVTTDKQLNAYLGIDPYAKYPQLAASELTPGMLAGALDAANNLPLTADKSESVEVTFTPEITALATSLHNNATEIYAWVHNNIRYIPSYGSIQGAQQTLETKQGNAIDTASLLISLLRVAKIPARYVYGTVVAPVDQVMNWVGGVTTPEAAQALMSKGGIPVSMVKENGILTSFRFEHVWVEAWVDFVPGRGTKNNNGNTWVPMDASFKQYDYTQGMNLKDKVPFDAQSLVNNIQQKATINTTEGWVQNVPQADIEQQLTQFQTALKTYIDNQNPNATVGDVLGLKTVHIIPARPLAAGLQIKRIVTSQIFSEVPDRLRHKFHYDLATTTQGYVNNTLLSIEEPTAKLAGKTLALSFKPSTAADENIIASRLPAPDANGNIDPNALPQTLPGYLINLTAEFTIDGQIVAQGNAGTMGGELHEELGTWNPTDQWRININKPTAGTYRAIGLDLQGTNPEQAARLKTKLEATKATLQSSNQTQLASLTKHDLVGDLLYGTVFNYFALNDLQDQISAQSSGITTYRAPSYGIFSTTLKTQYWYGVPRNVSFSGLNMDVDQLAFQSIDNTNNKTNLLAFMQASGSRSSAMEHLVPEQMFSTEQNQAQGISAVKALTIASQQGQKIWTIDQNNVDLALSKLTIDEDAKTDIRNSINAGKVVTAHQSQINFNGWVGEGYIVTDPLTGAGGYIIAGGGNGSDTDSIEKDLGLRLGWSGYLAPNESISGSSQIMSGVINYVGFGLNYVASWMVCNEELLKTIAIIALIVVAAVIVASLIPAVGFGIGVTLMGLLPISANAAKPTNEDSCKMDCSFASRAQLIFAGITDPERYKEDEYGAVPSSRYDICACRDGSIAIFKHNQCGQMNALWEVTTERWK